MSKPEAPTLPMVYKAINAVANELSKVGIAKEQENTHQRFMFRGIDDVYSALARPLVDCGLRIFPRVIARETTERATAKGGTAFATVLTVEYDFVAVSDGSKHTVCVVGEAADSGDKGHSKALSMAFKYACFQTFCIPVEGEEDADASTFELKGRMQEKREAASRPEPVMRGDSPPQGRRESAAPEAGAQEKTKHPILLQLEAALNKYGESRAKFEAQVAEKFGVTSIDQIKPAILPQALIAVQKHQKEAREKKRNAEGKKPPQKKPANEPMPPDDGDVPMGETDSSDVGDLPV